MNVGVPAWASKGKKKYGKGKGGNIGRGRGGGESSSQPLARKRKPFDVRFGQEEDADDICSLINASYAVEVGDEGVAFRKSYVLSSNEVIKALDGGHKRWYLLETADDAEEVVGCCLFSILKTQDQLPCRSAMIHQFAVSTTVQNKGVGSYFLRHLERVFVGLGAEHVKLSVPHHRVDILPSLKTRGYKEIGGESLDTNVTRQTFMLTLQKSLANATILLQEPSSTSKVDSTTEEGSKAADLMLSAAMTALGSMGGESNTEVRTTSTEASLPKPPTGKELGALIAAVDAMGIQQGPQSTEAFPSSLEGLLGSLSKQLKTDEGRKTFSELSSHSSS